MPLPLAHGLLGASVVAAVHPRACNWKPLLFGAILANCPDLDLLLVWGLDMRGLHRGFSHSPIFALLVTIVIWLIVGRKEWRTAMAYGLALLSHTVLDFAAAKAGGGVMLLWPFSTERFKFGVWGFAELSAGLPTAELVHWSSLESMIFLPVLLVILFIRGRQLLSHRTDKSLTIR